MMMTTPTVMTMATTMAMTMMMTATMAMTMGTTTTTATRLLDVLGSSAAGSIYLVTVRQRLMD
jgi:hypothetical protein